MAIGFGSKKQEAEAEKNDSDNNGFGNDGYYGGFHPDTERQGSAAPRKMSRIDRPVTGSITGRRPSAEEADEDPMVSVGKQMEMEAGNAIKYRTCSWQKV